MNLEDLCEIGVDPLFGGVYPIEIFDKIMDLANGRTRVHKYPGGVHVFKTDGFVFVVAKWRDEDGDPLGDACTVDVF